MARTAPIPDADRVNQIGGNDGVMATDKCRRELAKEIRCGTKDESSRSRRKPPDQAGQILKLIGVKQVELKVL